MFAVTTNPAPLVIPAAPHQSKRISTRIAADPIFKAIARRHAALARFTRLADELDEREMAARDKFGPCPFALVHWRNYSHIGRGEFDRVREEFLAEAGDNAEAVAIVWSEYRDVQRREQAVRRAIRAWQAKTGLADLAEKVERAKADLGRLEKAMTETVPTTPAGAGALLRYALDDDFNSEVDWHVAAVETVAVALAEMK